ncbi:MAG TPA: ankyrin repeat domain-containing protein [Oceanobacillus sp.]|nr:ankyrin repeat domain-containing protein [Oceanobacillus sp.]
MTTSTQLSQDQIDEFVVASHSDFEKVQKMLAENPALLNENATWMETPIQAAAHVGNRTIAEYLLEQGAPLDICTAAMLGLDEEVAAILADEPDAAHAVGAHNIPVLFYPAISGNIAIAERLLAAGADVNAGEGGNTPLHGAAGFGQPEMVRWLLDHDANPFAMDFNGKAPIEVAQANGHTVIVEMLRPYTDLDNKGDLVDVTPDESGE